MTWGCDHHTAIDSASEVCYTGRWWFTMSKYSASEGKKIVTTKAKAHAHYECVLIFLYRWD